MKLIDLITYSRKYFFFFVDKCNESYRSGHDLSIYRELIAIHETQGNLEALIEKDEFCRILYEALEAWDMNKRGARLISFNDFQKSLRFWKDYLVRLYAYKSYNDIEDEISTINEILEKVFINLKVMASKRKIVGVSKTLHFLLPDLIMPIDSTYTMPAFYGYNKYSESPKTEFNTFKEIFEGTFEIINRLGLSTNDVDGLQWNTSVPKLVDNAIIGFFNSEKAEVIALFNENR